MQVNSTIFAASELFKAFSQLQPSSYTPYNVFHMSQDKIKPQAAVLEPKFIQYTQQPQDTGFHWLIEISYLRGNHLYLK